MTDATTDIRPFRIEIPQEELDDLYGESTLSFGPNGVTLPTAISAFPEIYTAPESWVRAAYPNLIHYNRVAKGGHFLAWEQPDEFVSEMRESFTTLR